MYGLILSLFAVLPIPYEKAHEAYEKEGKTMVVVVGAEWCPACIVLDKRIRSMARTDFNYVHLDFDKDEELVKKIMVGTTIPYTIRYKWIMLKDGGFGQAGITHVGAFGSTIIKGRLGKKTVQDDLQEFLDR